MVFSLFSASTYRGIATWKYVVLWAVSVRIVNSSIWTAVGVGQRVVCVIRHDDLPKHLSQRLR